MAISGTTARQNCPEAKFPSSIEVIAVGNVAGAGTWYLSLTSNTNVPHLLRRLLSRCSAGDNTAYSIIPCTAEYQNAPLSSLARCRSGRCFDCPAVGALAELVRPWKVGLSRLEVWRLTGELAPTSPLPTRRHWGGASSTNNMHMHTDILPPIHLLVHIYSHLRSLPLRSFVPESSSLHMCLFTTTTLQSIAEGLC
jgi:hypothetical protein